MFFEDAVALRGQVLRASSTGLARGAPWECAVGQRGHWTWALEKLFSQVEGDVNSPPRRGDGASQGPCWGHHRQLWERVRGREQWEVSQGTSWMWGLEAWGSLWGLS